MNQIIGYLIFIAILFVGLFSGTGFNFEIAPFIIWLVFSTFIAFPFYIEYKKNKPPTKTERILATVWLFFRRFVCLVGAITFIAVLIFTRSYLPLTFQICLLIAIFLFIWWGIFGAGEIKGLNDDIYYHEMRKERYSKDLKSEIKIQE